VRAVLHRVRAFAGQLGLLAALAFVAALLAAGAPRVANGLADEGLRQDIRRLAYPVRDLTYASRPDEPGEAGAERLDTYADRLPQPLPGLVGERWFDARVGPQGLALSGAAPFRGSCPPRVSVRTRTGGDRTGGDRTGADLAVRIVLGHRRCRMPERSRRWCRATPRRPPASGSAPRSPWPARWA
jgi:hypothetical protein